MSDEKRLDPVDTAALRAWADSLHRTRGVSDAYEIRRAADEIDALRVALANAGKRAHEAEAMLEVMSASDGASPAELRCGACSREDHKDCSGWCRCTASGKVGGCDR